MSVYRTTHPTHSGTPLFVSIRPPVWNLSQTFFFGKSRRCPEHAPGTRQFTSRSKLKCSFNAINEDVALSSAQTEKLLHLSDLLLRENKKVNLTAIRTPEDVRVKHVQDAFTLLPIIDSEKAMSVVDVGTGAGFPGLVLAIARPDLRVTLLESVRKKTAFHDLVVQELGLANVTSMWARAEEAGQGALRETQCLAVARSVAEMRVLAELTLPLVRIGGAVIAQKALDEENSEVKSALSAVRKLGGVVESVQPAWPERWGDGGTLNASDGSVRVKSLVVVRKERKTKKEYPRNAGVPSKSPLR